MTYRNNLAVAVAAFTLIATPALISTQTWAADGGKSGAVAETGKKGLDSGSKKGLDSGRKGGN